MFVMLDMACNRSPIVEVFNMVKHYPRIPHVSTEVPTVREG